MQANVRVTVSINVEIQGSTIQLRYAKIIMAVSDEGCCCEANENRQIKQNASPGEFRLGSPSAPGKGGGGGGDNNAPPRGGGWGGFGGPGGGGGAGISEGDGTNGPAEGGGGGGGGGGGATMA